MAQTSIDMSSGEVEVEFDGELSEEEVRLIQKYRAYEGSKEQAFRHLILDFGFGAMGNEKGAVLAGLARELHPDAWAVVPLYRSCMVIPAQETSGNLRALLYHDPGWVGQPVTKEVLPQFVDDLLIQGQRSGPYVYKNGTLLVPKDVEETLQRVYLTLLEGGEDVVERAKNVVESEMALLASIVKSTRGRDLEEGE